MHKCYMATQLFLIILHKYLCFIIRLFIFGILYSSTLEKIMAPHSSTLAWKIPWMEEHGRLQFMGSLRVSHD